jgi:uncharacterized protein DUF4136
MKRFLILAGLIALASMAPTLAVSVKEDYNPKTDFSKYKTFQLKPGTPAPSPLTQAKIENAIVTQLTLKGLTEGRDNADLIIYTHVKVSVEKAMDVTSFGYGGYFGWSGWGGEFGGTSVNVVDIPMGTLMVDMVDRESQQMVWRGIAHGTIHANSTAEKSEKRINAGVAKLLKKFPPRAKK